MSLSNKYYNDDNVFDFEKSIIKDESWLLIAHFNELSNNNDFITFDYLGEKIFVQNFNGEIKSFQNICLHRFNSIHKEESGNRVSSCLYHNWVYNSDGKVAGLQCKNSFEKENIEKLKLNEYEIGNCGDFIFIKLNPNNTTTLKEYLGSMYQKLEIFSHHLGDKAIDYNMMHDSNWKLLIENVLECYHCASVHASSFAKMGYGFVKPEQFDFFNGHSWCEFPKKKGVEENKIVKKILDSRTLKGEGYMHFFIYPNAFISSVEGKGFYFGFILPLSASRTNLRIRYFSPIIETVLTESQINIVDFINKSSIDSLDLVLKEDKNIIEKIQSNIAVAINSSPIFGDEEFRINKFYNYFSPKFLDLNESI